MAFRTLSPFHGFLVAAFVLCAVGYAHALELKPFKDDLFAYPATLSTGDGGAYTVIDYREMRDINQRDEVPDLSAQGRNGRGSP